MHHIYSLRAKNPSTIIIMLKINVKSSYHRAILVPLLVAMRITKVDNTPLMILQMTFGGANGPFDWLSSSLNQALT